MHSATVQLATELARNWVENGENWELPLQVNMLEKFEAKATKSFLLQFQLLFFVIISICIYVYSISIENLFSISFSTSFTDINLFSISLSRVTGISLILTEHHMNKFINNTHPTYR